MNFILDFTQKKSSNMTYRQQGIDALKTVLSNENNINILDRYIFEQSTNEEMYKRYIFQTIGDVIKKEKLSEILGRIKKGKTGWRHPVFVNASNRIDEQDDFIEHPFEVEEGVIECKCGSKRVFSYSKQVRSADEPMSTFAHCVKCNKKWTYSG
jgi:DNA-directed RNA polymerase subunit M/transcription elongation factor TFIIS